MKVPDDFRIEDVPGRFIVGRPAPAAMLWVRNDEELDGAAKVVSTALKRNDDGKSLWEIYLLLIRHDQKYVEQLIIIDPDERGLDESEQDMVRQCLLETMYRVRAANVRDNMQLSKPPEIEEHQAR